MKKEDFIKLGLDEATATKCETASMEELKEYVTKADFDATDLLRKQADIDVKERDEQLETLKNDTGDVETLKDTIATMLSDSVSKDAVHEEELKKLKVDFAVELAIIGAKGKNAKAIKALLDLDNVELLEDGTVKGLTEQMGKLLKADDSKFLFDSEGKKQTFKGVKPGESGKEILDGKIDTGKMTYSELSAYMANNPNVKIH